MRKQFWLLSLTALTLTALCFPENSFAAPPSSKLGATAVIDMAYSGITGDVYGQTYTNGQLGVTCVFNLTDGNFWLNTADRQANPRVNPPRTLTLNFADPVSCAPLPANSDPSGPMTAFLNVYGIYSMPVGATRSNVVAEILLPEGRLQFASTYGPNAGYCSTYLAVQHPAANRWEIYATPNPSQPGSPRDWGDIAVRGKTLSQQTGGQPTNHYHLPFHLTATIP